MGQWIDLRKEHQKDPLAYVAKFAQMAMEYENQKALREMQKEELKLKREEVGIRAREAKTNEDLVKLKDIEAAPARAQLQQQFEEYLDQNIFKKAGKDIGKAFDLADKHAGRLSALYGPIYGQNLMAEVLERIGNKYYADTTKRGVGGSFSQGLGQMIGGAASAFIPGRTMSALPLPNQIPTRSAGLPTPQLMPMGQPQAPGGLAGLLSPQAAQGLGTGMDALREKLTRFGRSVSKGVREGIK